MGTDGRFATALSAGTYSLVGRSPEYNGGSVYDCQAFQTAVVIARRVTSTTVYCEVR